MLDLLAGSGSRLEMDRSDGIYRIVQDTSVGQGWANLGDSQWADFYPLLTAMNRQPTLIPFSVQSIERQLREVLDFPDGVENHVFFKTAISKVIEPDILRTLFDAWHQGCRVLITPRLPRKAISADPLFLVAYQGNWHLVAVAGDWTMQYNLARVESVRLLPEEPCTRVSPSELLTLRSRLENLYGIAFIDPDRGIPLEPQVAKVRFLGVAATFARERYVDITVDGDSVVVSFRVHTFYELVSDLLVWGALADPLEPEEFRNEWLDRLEEIIPVLKAAGRI